MSQSSDLLYHQLRIASISEGPVGFKTFTFSGDHGLTYKSGQYLTIVHNHQEASDIRRSYSICSCPDINEPLTIGVKRIDNGMLSRNLNDNSHIGDLLLTTGIGGMFTLPQDTRDYNTVVFFAAGSGITPVISLIKSVLHSQPHLHAVLIYSNHSEATTIFYRELMELQVQFASRFQIEFLFSRIADLHRARLNRDLLLQILNTYASDKEHTLFFVCGPQAYMRMIIYTLNEQLYPPNCYRKEDFIPIKPSQRITPPDQTTRRVRIFLKGAELQFPVEFPDPITVAAKKSNIQLPYSCETGKCGSCVAKCVEGKVWMSDNEVLMDEDLKQGLVLTCVGHPNGGDITLIID